MPTPFNQLQHLSVNLSGREIGIDKFKPYTAGNERIPYEARIAGKMFKSVLESGRFSAPIASGAQNAVLTDKKTASVNISGDFSFTPTDKPIYALVLSGLVDSTIYDVGNFANNLKSGDFIDIVGDFQNANLKYSGVFSGEYREIGNLGTYYSGNFRAQEHDSSDFDFIFFTGSYYEGHFSVNMPITGEDNAEIDFIFFTGSYQG